MKTQTTLKDAIGKPLTDYAESPDGPMILIFGDEYVCLRARRFGEYEEEIAIQEADLSDLGELEIG